jgi:hypothetical protein
MPRVHPPELLLKKHEVFPSSDLLNRARASEPAKSGLAVASCRSKQTSARPVPRRSHASHRRHEPIDHDGAFGAAACGARYPPVSPCWFPSPVSLPARDGDGSTGACVSPIPRSALSVPIVSRHTLHMHIHSLLHLCLYLELLSNSRVEIRP